MHLPPDTKLIFATAAWQYSHHVLPGLGSRRGPILTVANWSGQWPGLVALLNLNGSLVKASVKFSSLWSRDFTESFFRTGLAEWVGSSKVTQDLRHIRPLDPSEVPAQSATLAKKLATNLSSANPSSASWTGTTWACKTPSSTMNCSIPQASTMSAWASPRSSQRCAP